MIGEDVCLVGNLNNFKKILEFIDKDKRKKDS
jgi:hypothetical protein